MFGWRRLPAATASPRSRRNWRRAINGLAGTGGAADYARCCVRELLLAMDRRLSRIIPAEEPTWYYYAIENLESGSFVWRGTATSPGIPPFGVILAPDTRYRERLYPADTGLISSVEFRSPLAGRPLKIRLAPLDLPN
jgi:hypothetical protein